MRYHIAGSLSEHIKETPEGYLLCLDVPIARTGVQEYQPEEVPLEAAGHGPVRIYRMEAEVFAPETVASFEGKPVTLDHPEDNVSPESWRELARGVAQNLRRGEGESSDLLLADLLITDAEAIAAVRGGLREISCGYDAEYEGLGPGVGRQTGIIGNHVALVQAGRCGPRCAIIDTKKDVSMNKAPKDMLTKEFRDWMKTRPKLQKAFDEALAEEEPKAPPKEDPPAAKDDDPLAALIAKVEEMSIILRGLTEKAPAAPVDEEPTGDEDPDKAADGDPGEGEDPKEPRAADRKAAVADAETVRRAGLLSPSLRARAGDSDCAVKRAALRAAMADSALKKTVDACLRGSSLDKADCLTLDAAFVAASEVAAIAANRRTADALLGARGVKDFGKTVTPAEINAANRAYYDKEKK